MPRTARPLGVRIQTDALLVRKIPFNDADLVVTFFTEDQGILSTVARSARRSAKRFPALEPMHLLRVSVDERAGADLVFLVEAAIVRPRLGLTSDLDKLDAAGRALRWVRRAMLPRAPEPVLWEDINALLDDLDGASSTPPVAQVAGMGLRLLAAIGWGLDLTRCVRCGRPCDAAVSACVDAASGGLVCRACGGARMSLREDRRARLIAAQQGDDTALDAEDAAVAIELVDAALEAHTG